MPAAEEPYIGEQSIPRPPRSKKVRSTSARASRKRRSSPTLKVIQEPMPITGTASPLDGMARVIGAASAVGKEPAKGSAARPPSTARRDVCQEFFMRSEEHTSELQSLMRISYAVFCLK